MSTQAVLRFYWFLEKNWNAFWKHVGIVFSRVIYFSDPRKFEKYLLKTSFLQQSSRLLVYTLQQSSRLPVCTFHKNGICNKFLLGIFLRNLNILLTMDGKMSKKPKTRKRHLLILIFLPCIF